MDDPARIALTLAVLTIVFFVIGAEARPTSTLRHSAEWSIRSRLCDIYDLGMKCGNCVFIFDMRSGCFLEGG